MAAVQQQVTVGAGMALVEGSPIERLSAAEATAVFWLLGRLLSRPVATKWDGTFLYDVTDTGRRFGYGVRGSATNVELSFHTDNAFGVALPDVVGLLCIQPALEGGVNRCCSLYTVHNELLRRQPQLLLRLYQPCYYDRQAEHAPEAPKLLWAPVFRWDGERLSARLTPNLIRRGYELAGEPMDEALIAALAALEDVLAQEALRIEFTLRRGDIQYLNNHWCAHFRSAFTDSEDPALKRHLVRVWYRDWGGPGYDGNF
jgi:Taurine catabolism dioxygenase TauD, TfdA family